MFQLPRVLRNFNLYIDGSGFAGRIERATPPAMALALEEIRAGGMDAPVKHDMGMEAMTFSGVLVDYGPELRRLFGRPNVQFLLRGSAKSQGQERSEPILITMRAMITRLEDGEWSGNTKTQNNFTADLTSFKYRQGDVEHVEIDIPGFVRRFGDYDALADQRIDLAL